MKKLIAILPLFLLAASFLVAQTPTAPTTSGSVMTFESTTIDYGTIDQGSDPNRIFKFTNTGKEPLVIKNARASCGCTVPNWPKEPIMPGEAGTIEVRYDTNRVGPFTKNITVETNENDGNTHSLTIKGTINAKQAAPGVPGSSSNMFNN